MKVIHPLKKKSNSTRNHGNKSKENASSTSTTINPTESFTPALTPLLALVSAGMKTISSVDTQATTVLQEVDSTF